MATPLALLAATCNRIGQQSTAAMNPNLVEGRQTKIRLEYMNT